MDMQIASATAGSIRREMAHEELAMWCLRNADLIAHDVKMGFRMSLPKDMEQVVNRMAELSMPADGGRTAKLVIDSLVARGK